MDSYISVMSVPVSDPDAAKAWYVDTLGMKVVRDDRDVRLRWIMLRPRGGQTAITLVTWFDTMPMGSLRGTVLAVPDIEAAALDLRRKGVLEPDEEITDAPWGRYVTVEDPDGNGWIIQQNNEDFVSLATYGTDADSEALNAALDDEGEPASD